LPHHRIFLGAEAVMASIKENNISLISSMSNGLETLNNLIYLICEDADQPPRVRHYANMCEERLQVMTSAVNSMREQL
jgi:hypothetical protein